MLLRLLAAFILIPLIELVLLLRLADATSWVTTLIIVLVTGVIGSILARREGVAAWFRFQNALQNGRMPSREIRDGLMIAFAAALLLTPGLLTDGLGFALLTPMGRSLISKWLGRRFQTRFEVHSSLHRSGNQTHAESGSAFDGVGRRESGSRTTWTIDSPNFGPKQDSGATPH